MYDCFLSYTSYSCVYTFMVSYMNTCIYRTVTLWFNNVHV